MDTFIEYIVKKKKDTKDYIIMAATVLGLIVLALACLIFNRMLFGIPFILLVFAVWGSYFIFTSRNIEYEYILTNSELDIDKIVARRSRKRVITINFKEIEVCAKTDNPNFKHNLDNKANVTRTEYLQGNMKSENVYFVDFTGGSGKTRVFFEPNERILNELKKINPRCINI